MKRLHCFHALSVAIALLASLFLSIFVIPALCIMFLKPHPEKESVIMKHAKNYYLPLLEAAAVPCSLFLILGTQGILFDQGWAAPWGMI